MIFIPDQKTGIYYRNNVSLITKLKGSHSLMFRHCKINQYL